MWDNKVIPFWQKILIFQNRFPILISEGKDYRFTESGALLNANER